MSTTDEKSTHWFVKLLIFAGMGFFIVTVLPPILAFLSSLVVFAAFGYLGYGIYCYFFKPADPSDRLSDSEYDSESGDHRPRAQVWMASSEQFVRQTAPKVKEHGERTARWISGKARTAWTVIFEACCGTAVGSVLGLLAHWGAPNQIGFVALSALVGGLLGVIVGSARVAATPHTEAPS